MVRMKRTPYKLPKKVRVVDPEAPEKSARKKTRRWKAGTVALREIKFYQKSGELLIQRGPFERVVREITDDLLTGLRYEKKAIEALHESSEAYLTGLLAKAYKFTLLEKLVTIMPRHLQAALEK